MGFPRQEYWSGLPFHTPGDLPDPGIYPCPTGEAIPLRGLEGVPGLPGATQEEAGKLELGIALQSLQGKIGLIYACVQDLVFHYWADRDLRVAFSTHPESQASS